jgi:uncharacterized repeat protein (TIGR03803 family)
MRRSSFHFFRALTRKVCPFSAALLCAVSTALYLTACGAGTTGKTQTPGSSYSAKVIYNFGASPDGYGPAVGVVLDAKGNLYGTTVYGGTFGEGTVFKLAPNGGQWTETVLYSFCHTDLNCADGSQPTSKVTLDSAGNLYGTASLGGLYSDSFCGSGCGVVFKLTPQQDGTWAETVLHTFQGEDGAEPWGGSLLFDNVGNLYGTTEGGGASDWCLGDLGCGTVFELSLSANGQWTERPLAWFYNNSDGDNRHTGSNPIDGITFDSDGNLYGTTRTGPSWGYPGGPPAVGEVFELGPTPSDLWSQSWPYDFQGGTADGATPTGGLVVDNTGAFYGTTSAGGSSTLSPDSGTVFKLTLGTNNNWNDTVLYNFCALPVCGDGSHPMGGVVLDQSGNLYGTTLNGGVSDGGVVFKLEPQSDGTWTQSTLYTFQSVGTGYAPFGLTIDSSGNLYVVAAGGAAGNGVIVELVPKVTQ